MNRDRTVNNLNLRLRRMRAADPAPVNADLVNTVLEILHLADMRMGDAVRSGPHVHAAIIRTRGEIRHLASALLRVSL